MPKFLVSLTADIVAAYVANNMVAIADVPYLLATTHAALTAALESPQAQGKQEPAVPLRRAVRADEVVCLECGTRLKLLKRHLAAEHGVTTQDYLAKWNLPRDFPLVAPDYAAKRSRMARDSGLGRKPRSEPRSS